MGGWIIGRNCGGIAGAWCGAASPDRTLSWCFGPMRSGVSTVVPRMDGNFALVVWDAQKQQAFCARDHIGYKPFYFQWKGETLVFASELQPLLKLPWVPEEINEGMVAEYLANEWHSRDETFWKGVNRLVAAHRMTVGRQGPRSEQYWATFSMVGPALLKRRGLRRVLPRAVFWRGAANVAITGAAGLRG